ncbi:class I SAM-dependent methyltransferase [bacterium]|nr:class I SAM-dependent methyltransferase [bacterium]
MSNSTKSRSERMYEALLNTHKYFFDYDKEELKEEFACHLAECPACGSKRINKYWTKDWFKIDRCPDCGFVFVNPRMNDKATYEFYNQEWINIYNEGKFYNKNVSDKNDADVIENIKIFELLYKHLEQKEGNIIEIGPGGVGAFLNCAMEKGYDVTGVELGEENCNILRQLLGEKANIIQSTLEGANLPSDYFVGGSMRDVLEHIPNPKDFLKELNRILKLNAYFTIQVPNVAGLIYKFAKQSHTVVFPFEHPNYWSPKALTKILNDTGFAVESIEHFADDFTLSSINNYMNGESTFTTCFKREQDSAQKSMYKRISKLLKNRFIKSLDDKFTPQIAEKLKKGSVIRVLARKIQNI